MIALWSPAAAAQVNAEALRGTLKNNPRFLWLEGSLVGRVGNTENLMFSGNAFSGVTFGSNLLFSKVSADYGHARSRTTVARWLGHARYNYRLSSVVALEALAQVQHDRFRRLEERDLYGAGVRIEIVNEDDFEVLAGTTGIIEHEIVSAPPGMPDLDNVWIRSSNFGGVNFRVAPLVEFSSVAYVQPRVDRPIDFRVLSDTLVSFTMTPMLSARITATIWYDHRPPYELRPYDVEIKNGLVLKF